VAEDAHEREIERGLLLHLRDLLLELGRGFSFIGSQVPLRSAMKPSIYRPASSITSASCFYPLSK